MAFNNAITTMIFGRRLGLQSMSSNVSGAGTSGTQREWLVGPDGFRMPTTTADSSSVNLNPSGCSLLSTVQSTGIYVLDPPVPGVIKTIAFGTTGAGGLYVKVANPSVETILTTQGSTMTVLKSTAGNGGSVMLVAMTTAVWACVGSVTTGLAAGATTT